MPEMPRVGPDGDKLRTRPRTEILGPPLELPVTGEGVLAAIDTHARVASQLLELQAG